MKRLIFGSGKTASIIKNDGDIVIPHQQCDITNAPLVRTITKEVNPDIVVNCAAKTNLEYCEDNKRITFDTNTVGPINVLMGAAETGAKFVHISSGCIFDGNDRVCDEDSVANTSVWYTHTKKWADEYITACGYENYLILRPRQMISATPHPTNMLTKFAQYDEIFVHTELNSLTCVEDFSEMLEHLLKTNQRGIFNCCNDGLITPYDVALGVKKYIKPSLKVNKVTYEYTLKLQPNRRVNTILSNDKIKNTGYSARSAHAALEWTLKNYAKA